MTTIRQQSPVLGSLVRLPVRAAFIGTYAHGRRMTWSVVGAAYLRLFAEVRAEQPVALDAAGPVSALRTIELRSSMRDREASSLG